MNLLEINSPSIYPSPPNISKTKTNTPRFNINQLRHRKLKEPEKDYTILIIEDDAFTFKVFSRQLNKIGKFDIIHYTNGIEGICYFKDNISKIDMAIIDYHLPDINGLQILHMLHELLKPMTIYKYPMFIFTSSNLPIITETIIKDNNLHFIEKPIDINNLSRIINNYSIRDKPFLKITNTIDFLDIKKPTLIGSGSFSTCYKCLWKEEEAVIKFISYHNSDKRNNIFNIKASILKNINNEVRIMNTIHHNYIIKTYNTFIGYNETIILMEYANKGDLFDKIGLDLDTHTIKLVTLQVAIALQYLHYKNIIHRDIKAENILIGLDGNIRLCDFGFSCYNSGKTLCGTVDYIAPEIITNKQYDHTIDYWSLGILLYEMYHKNTPFQNTTLSIYNYIHSKIKFIENMPDSARELFNQLTELNNTKRKIHFQNNLHNIKDMVFMEDIDFDCVLKGNIHIF